MTPQEIQVARARALEKTGMELHLRTYLELALANDVSALATALLDTKARLDFAHTALRAVNYCVLCARFPRKDGHGPDCLVGQALENS